MIKNSSLLGCGDNYDERSAGGIVYKLDGKKILWLIIYTISKNQTKGIYKLPKGHLKKDEFLKDAALREVEEEGKIKAEIVFKLGSNDYLIWNKETRIKIVKKVTFFLMKYVNESRLRYYDGETVIAQEWVEFKEAKEKLAFDSEKKLLEKAIKEVNKFI